MLRAYCSSWKGDAALPQLDREEVHHLVRVRRVRIGEEVEILNGRGDVALCKVESTGKSTIEFSLVRLRHPDAPPLRRHLLVAIPKGKTFPSLLHKAVELGVDEITPLLTEYSEVASGKAGQKADRWETILIEAVKQSGNPRIPVLNAPCTLPKALPGSRADNVQRVCAALQPEARPLWGLLEDSLRPEGTIEVFVGPEGDFSATEYALLQDSGIHFVSLGPLVLKVETAASLIMGALGLWMGNSR